MKTIEHRQELRRKANEGIQRQGYVSVDARLLYELLEDLSEVEDERDVERESKLRIVESFNEQLAAVTKERDELRATLARRPDGVCESCWCLVTGIDED